MSAQSFEPTPRARQAAQAMLVRSHRAHLDASAARVVEALAAAGIDSLLLRGPVFERVLYDEDEVRPYSDCDILVPADRYPDAEAVIAAAGFSPGPRPEAADAGEWHALTWQKKVGNVALDIHRTLIGAKASPLAVWRSLAADATTMVIGGVTVPVPSHPGTAVVVALHVAEHGPRWSKPEEDLRRAIARLTREEWARAAEIARAIDADGAMRAGLSRIEGGAELADELGLPDPGTEAQLRAGARDGMAMKLERLAKTQGLAAKVGFLLRALWPAASSMRSRHPIATKGSLGLVVAYVIRPFVLLGRFPRNLREWVAVRWVKRR